VAHSPARTARLLPAVAALALGACGYALTSGVSRLPAGAETVSVAPLANRTTDAEAGALVAVALRRELARRGAEGGPGSPALLAGEVEEISAVPSVGAATWRLTLVVRASLSAGGRALGEARVRHSEDYLGGVDALESEGRRRIALRRAADGAARELIERLER
jgi:hypothetical protein